MDSGRLMRRMVTRRRHRLGRSKRKLPCREKRWGREAGACLACSGNNQEPEQLRRKEKVDVGSKVLEVP